MEFWEILIIIAIVAFVAIVFGIRIYKIVTGKVIDECASCQLSSKKKLEAYRKKHGKNKKNKE